MELDNKINEIINYCRQTRKNWTLSSTDNNEVLHVPTQNGMIDVNKYNVLYYNMTRRDKLLGLSYKSTKYKNVERVACRNGALLLFKGQEIIAKIKF